MEDLMKICNHWGAADCHPDIREFYLKEIKEGEEALIWPVGEELKKLDEICKNCKKSIFFVEEPKCPVCDNHDVEKTGGTHDMPGLAKAHGFRCINCEAKFWIFEKDLTP